MTKTELRQRLLDEENRLTVRQNGRLDAAQKVFDKMYEVLKKTEYDLLKDFLSVEGRLQQVEEMLLWEKVRDKRG